ncbi:MAG: D-aminoacyl-tRNA deacylase [Desulfovibrio sp.]|uniref:D-aminoacyl-tRNA deacylase n=1 Tax=Desulfovibrio sp. 7SRBS1 TaxID=3378064 RepID=UPI003B3C0205
MRLLLQRVRSARVDVKERTVGRIDAGLLVLAGFGPDDGPDAWESTPWQRTVDKMLDLRIFPDAQDKMNLSIKEYGGSILCVSQFTLYADCRRGRRPSFSSAAAPDVAEALYGQLLTDLERAMPGRVERGEFGAMMDVSLVNWGPVTIMLDSQMFES